RGNLSTRPATAESRPPSELVAPLIGRASAFSQLTGRYQQARQGQPQAVLVVGEAGIGKTRLATGCLRWAGAQGADVLSGPGGGLRREHVYWTPWHSEAR